MKTVVSPEPVVLPAEQLYWHRLGPNGGRTSEARAYAFESVLPVALEDVHVVETKLAEGGWLLVGVPLTLMRHAQKQEQAERAGIRPASIPDHLDIAAHEHADLLPRLDFCTGPFTAQDIRRTHRSTQRWLTVIVVVIMGCVVLGSGHRIWELRSEIDRLQIEQERIIQEAVADVPGSAAPAAKLVMALRKIDSVQGQARNRSQPEAWELFQAILKRWPVDTSFAAEHISVDRQRCVIRGHAPTLAICEALAASLQGAEVRGRPLTVSPIQVRQEYDKVAAVALLEWGQP